MEWLPATWQQVDYAVIGAGFLLVLAHWAWCGYIAYPMELEKQFKSGKPWVYIPLGWSGGRKLVVRLFSRILILISACAAVFLIHHFLPFRNWGLGIATGLVSAMVFWRLHQFWVSRRYRQVEDVYFHLHDQLRSKLLKEGKYPAETAFKSLANYQFQSLLRQADERGELLLTLRREKKSARRKKPPSRMEEALEMS